MAAPDDTVTLSHAEAWALIPWLINGTLGDDEAIRVRAHCDVCARCRREMSEQARLAAAVADHDLQDDVLEGAWAAMRVRLQGSVPAGRGRDGRGQDRRWWRWGWWAVPAATAAAAVTLLVATPSPPPAPFVTLTEPLPRPVHSVLRVRAQPGVEEATVRRLFEAHGLTVIDGPGASGVYTVSAADAETLSRAAAALAGSPAVAAVVSRTAEP